MAGQRSAPPRRPTTTAAGSRSFRFPSIPAPPPPATPPSPPAGRRGSPCSTATTGWRPGACPPCSPCPTRAHRRRPDADARRHARRGRPPLWFEGDCTPVDIPFGFFIERSIPRADRPRRELGLLKPLMRRAFLTRHALAYDETLRLGEDYDLYARALAHGARMRLVPWTGYVSEMRADSLSARHTRADLAALEAADDRLLASPAFKPSERRLVRKHRFSARSKLVWIDFMAALKSGAPLRALSIMLEDARQAPYVLAGLWKIAVRRVRDGR